MVAPLVQVIGGMIVREVVKEVAPKVVAKVIKRATRKSPPKPTPKAAVKVAPKGILTRSKRPASNPLRKERSMNPVYLGMVRHAVQFIAGMVGAEAYASGDGYELAVAAVVSLANLGWYVWSNRKVA